MSRKKSLISARFHLKICFANDGSKKSFPVAKVTVEVLIESVVSLRLNSVIRHLEVVGLNPAGC